ncbi:MAG TPA: hypothetical protein PLZ96_08175, partial [Bacteroidales bacterium]|nr:hypothetical protein [Bacteroidales bacterium]
WNWARAIIFSPVNWPTLNQARVGTMNDLYPTFNFILYENKKYAIDNGPFAQLYGLPARS